MMSPSNSILTNPEVMAETTRTFGQNLVQGSQSLIEDMDHALKGKPPVGAEDYLPGRDVAVTPGKVVYRSHLFELIQYAPQTETVTKEPLLIVPAWIMKYYILDLSPENSLVRHLVGQGFTVFMVSWRNPDAQDRDLGMDDHVAPWHSVFKLNLLSDTEVTFVLTSGGHNAGIISEPGHKGRTYQIKTAAASDRYIPPEDWRAQVGLQDGSWWPDFARWLAERSAGKVAPPPMGTALGDAPGTYVLQR